ncbi:MAG: glycerol-3-phosphate 1-O-acyltransferase PlsY [Proteobacteria bacterium]|nr:glycerol-3-phosphate 1-O-acyltransferase PlsY [Pseudomonadota bacterium]
MDTVYILKLAGLIIGAYMLGSIPFGLILANKFSSVDIRTKGSGNIGATNVMRVSGKTLGVLTLAGDLLKGAFPVYLACCVLEYEGSYAELYISIVIIASFLGHLYPIYLKFKDGGKGVATAAGCFLITSPVALLIAITVFIFIVIFYRRVAAASLSASMVLPFAIWFEGHSFLLTGCAVIISLFIFYRHKDNIKRLLSGTEPSI